MLHRLRKIRLLMATAKILPGQSKIFCCFTSYSWNTLQSNRLSLNCGFQATPRLPRTSCFWNRFHFLQYSTVTGSLHPAQFEQISKETLESLVEYLEELAEQVPTLKNADIAYSDGVITAFLGDKLGTYVINRQTPNQQIWLSSPTTGPKRYDFVDGAWIYKHDNTSLHSLLDREIGSLVNKTLEFSSHCSFGKK